MSYPFYLGETLATAAAARDVEALCGLAKRNFDVIMNTHSQSWTMRKMRVVQLEALISRAVYRAGAEPEPLFEVSMQFLDRFGRTPARDREQLKATLIDFCRCAMEFIPQFPHSHPNLLQRFLREVEQDVHGKLRVADAARRLNVSASHLSRMVKLATGRAPHEYIQLHKLARARERLAEVSVTQAALENGFGKVSTFISLFRKHHGETPGAYKRRVTLDGRHPTADQIRGIDKGCRALTT
jgi:AraC-like DNA-binding protein